MKGARFASIVLLACALVAPAAPALAGPTDRYRDARWLALDHAITLSHHTLLTPVAALPSEGGWIMEREA